MLVVWAGVATPAPCTLLSTAIDAYPDLATPDPGRAASLHIGKWPFGLVCGFSLSVSLGRLSWGTCSFNSLFQLSRNMLNDLPSVYR